MGTVDFKNNIVVETIKGSKKEIAIKRTDNQNRKRVDAGKRFGADVHNDSSVSNMELVDERDFEYLAWNFRNYKLGIKFENKNLMVAGMYN